jgi:predicted alpha/beta-hydrolase family hydrolase
MRTPFLEQFAALAAERGVTTHRFCFAFMAATGRRRPAPRAESLIGEFRAAVAAMPTDAPLLIGGKSMGGRVASLLADELYGAQRIAGLVCLGYPFHPPKQPDRLRTQHLLALACPALIVQGECDPFGTRSEVEALTLSPAIRFAWLPDADHDFRVRRALSRSRGDSLAAAAEALAAFGRGLHRAAG